MNLIRFKSVYLVLFWLFLFFKFDQTTSTTPFIMMDDEGYCGFSDAEEDLCSSYCYKSVKPPLTYIMELKEQMKAKAKEHLETDNEIREIRQRLLELSDFREQFKALNQQNEELRKINEILRETNQHRNIIEKTKEDQELKEKDLSECIANRDTLKKEIEVEKNNRIKMEERYKLDMENLKKEKKTKEEILNNQIKDINSQVSSYRKQLEEAQNQLTEKDILVESNSLKIKTIEKDLGECKELPKTSCKSLRSGIYKIKLAGLDPFPALCNGDLDGGGWLVIQKRFDGSEDFYRNWVDYSKGFGKVKGEFFIGLEPLHWITNSERYELYIQMEYLNETFQFARYNNFKIGNENEKYELKAIGDFSGTVGRNLLDFSLHAKFSTFDQDNDELAYESYAKNLHSGWWHQSILGPNLNGKYYKGDFQTLDTMRWNQVENLKSVEMLIRPKGN